MALIDDVRTSLRIKSMAYDDDINIYIQSCLYDLERLNIVTTDTDSTEATVYTPEVKTAVIAYVKSQFGNGNEDKKKLIEVFMSQFFKDIDEKQMEHLLSIKGSDNPLFLKIILIINL